MEKGQKNPQDYILIQQVKYRKSKTKTEQQQQTEQDNQLILN